MALAGPGANLAIVLAIALGIRIGVAMGAFDVAYERYTELQKSPELRSISAALEEHAAFRRACALYEQGRERAAVTLWEDLVRRQFRLSAETDAALAIALYSPPLRRTEDAEALWESATALDSRFLSTKYVRETRGWGPRLIEAKGRFDRLE